MRCTCGWCQSEAAQFIALVVIWAVLVGLLMDVKSLWKRVEALEAAAQTQSVGR